jgi:glycosyltransferase involved in cell wall biosynthesis
MVRAARAQASLDVAAEKTLLIYAGGLTADRGIRQMLAVHETIASDSVGLYLFGAFDDPTIEARALRTPGVKCFGMTPLDAVLRACMSATMGLALFQPVRAYAQAGENTNKIFEYMACGLPIIASKFPTLRRIVEGNNCGICVDPSNVEEIAAAVRFLQAHPEVRREMGENGCRLVREKWNWELESKKLLDVYHRLLQRSGTR